MNKVENNVIPEKKEGKATMEGKVTFQKKEENYHAYWLNDETFTLEIGQAANGECRILCEYHEDTGNIWYRNGEITESKRFILNMTGQISSRKRILIPSNA